MTKTKKIKNTHNETKKNKTHNKPNHICPIGLKLFEQEFSKTIPQRHLLISNERKKEEFVKELMKKK